MHRNPPVQGLGTIGGFKLYVEDRGDLGLDELYENTQKLLAAGYQTPQLAAGVHRSRSR